MKKIINFFIIIVVFLNNFQITFGNELKATTTKSGYELYKDRVKNFCEKFKNPQDGQALELIYTFELDYPDLGKKTSQDDIYNSISMYKDFMDSLYACATNLSAKRQFNLIKEKLIKQSPNLRVSLNRELDSKINSLETKTKKLKGKCKISGNEINSQVKKVVLNQTTYELCKYNYYLEYLYWQNENALNLQTGDSIGDIAGKVVRKGNIIKTEMNNSYKTTSLVFDAYSNYEDNIGTHILLQLIREDFSEYRDQLHKTLNPINQVVYKISNAMKY